jgi:hypothetical protein
MDLILAILYAPDGQRPLSIARIDHRGLLAMAAEQAISEVEGAANGLTTEDPVLAALQREEARRLRRVFSLLLPSVTAESTSIVM